MSGNNPSGGDHVSGSATFYYSSSDKKTLIIDLVNTTLTTDPRDVLVGLAST